MIQENDNMSQIDRYDVIEEADQGKFATVCKAPDEQLNWFVAPFEADPQTKRLEKGIRD